MSVFFIHLCIYVPNKNSSNPSEWNPVFPISIAPPLSASSRQALHKHAKR